LATEQSSAFSGCLLGEMTLLATIGIVFIAQFRAERG